MGPGSHCKPSVFRSIPNALRGFVPIRIGWRALYTQGEVFRKEGDRLRRRMSPSLHSPPLGFFRAQLAGSRSANPAQTGALIRMFYLTRHVSLLVRFGVLDGTVTRCS